MFAQLLEKIPFLNTLKWVIVGLSAVAMLTIIWLGYRHYTGLVSQVQQLSVDNKDLQTRLGQQEVLTKQATDRVQAFADNEKQILAAVDAMGKANAAARSELQRLEKLFAEHDLGALSKAHPDMVGARLNAGTRSAQRMLECASGNAASCSPGAPGPH